MQAGLSVWGLGLAGKNLSGSECRGLHVLRMSGKVEREADYEVVSCLQRGLHVESCFLRIPSRQRGTAGQRPERQYN